LTLTTTTLVSALKIKVPYTVESPVLLHIAPRAVHTPAHSLVPTTEHGAPTIEHGAPLATTKATENQRQKMKRKSTVRTGKKKKEKKSINGVAPCGHGARQWSWGNGFVVVNSTC
jgi:hypothetical protein